MDIIVTCPPMLGQIDSFHEKSQAQGLTLHPANVTQILSVPELLDLIPQYDGWIIGDDPATREVFEAGKAGRLKAAVKWGIGVDNVDFAACKDLGLPIINTPMMFGREVADNAVAYTIGLARDLFVIDREVRKGHWPKPAGISLAGRTVGVVGLGDIGLNTVTRMQALGMNVIAYDPGVQDEHGIANLRRAAWPEAVGECDFIVLTCALNAANKHMMNTQTLSLCKPGVRIVNVARGPLIDEQALIAALQSGHVDSAAMDVFEIEPLQNSSPLRAMERCIFGTHNSSNTIDGVIRASHEAIDKLSGFLGTAPSS